jgi:hypothetical protein
MTPFSASDAALEGFELLRRHWRVVLGWAGFNLLALAMLVVATAVLAAATATGDSVGGPAAVTAGAGLGLGVLVIQAIIAGGVFRLELRPEQPAFLHLRLGADELRLLGVWFITLTGAWVSIWVAAALGEIVRLPGVWLGLVALALVVYLGLRFSLAAPISFAEHRIDFPRSWRLTHGRVLPLLGMSALCLCLIALLMVLVMLALGLVAVGAAGLDGVAGLFGGADSLQRHPGLYALEFAVQIVLTPVLWVLGFAPFLAAYRAFTASSAA